MGKIYCDLDGVLVDFDRGIFELTGKYPNEISDEFMWPRVMKAKTFYRDLHWKVDGRQLWDYIEHHNPSILTGSPRAFSARDHKRQWVEREIGEHIEVIVCLSKEKQNFCQPGDILIDDRVDIGRRWEAKNGIFILHRNAKDSIMKLLNLGI